MIIARLVWRLVTEEGQLWVEILKAKYKRNNKGRLYFQAKQYDSHTWRGICETRKCIENGIGKTLSHKHRRILPWQKWCSLMDHGIGMLLWSSFHHHAYFEWHPLHHLMKRRHGYLSVVTFPNWTSNCKIGIQVHH